MITRAFTDSLASKPDPFTNMNEVNMWSITCLRQTQGTYSIPVNVSDKKDEKLYPFA